MSVTDKNKKSDIRFKKRNDLKTILSLNDCPQGLGLYGGCGYVRYFSKMVFDGEYDVVLKKNDFKQSSDYIIIENGIISRLGQNSLEFYVDNYFGTIHSNGRNDKIYLVRDSTYFKNYHWRFSGDTLILHEWKSKKNSHMYDIDDIVLKMIKRK